VTTSSAERPHVHILGGGVGGMTTAFHLSSGDWPKRFSGITVHQLGWRLGGKGASGRNRDRHQRIEEHGLHIWFGFYENAFRMLDACHRELDDRARDGCPRWDTFCTSVDESFIPIHRVGLMEDANRSWRPWVAEFPCRPGLPWDRDLEREPSGWPASVIVHDYAAQLVLLGRTVIGSLEGGFRAERRHSRETASAINAFEHLLGLVARTIRTAGVRSALDRRVSALEARQWVHRHGAAIASALGTADLLIDATGLQLSRVFRQSEEVRRLWAIVDLVLAVLRGLLRDRVVDERSLQALDEREFRTWLVANGATIDSVDGPFVRAIVYDLAFAYERGRTAEPSCGAGTAVRGLHRTLFTYRGALMWKLCGGMGDVVFAPLYELLCKRGVTFEFFHQVTALRAERGRVTSFEYRQQAQMPAGNAEEMLVKVDIDRPGRCWPAAPPDRSGLEAMKLESTWWREGKAEPVDTADHVVVLAISVAALPYVAGDLIARAPAWQRMIRRLQTVPTEALQMWVRPDTSQLGWEDDAIVGGYSKPFDTWSDMPAALQVEPKADEPVGSLAYFCSVIDLSGVQLDRVPASDAEMRAHFGAVKIAAEARLRADVDSFVRQRLPLLWPGTTTTVSANEDEGDVGEGRPRLDIELGRYERVNFDPTERYVLSVPGSSHCRLRPDRSGFANLYLAGDWTECTLNAGCVEAAVISGMIAARAITGRPLEIIGERRETG
jgi:uncharacterized protein with NAD-binding domain and iron-sulfur cluster